MTITQQIITIGLCTLATLCTRYIPFLLFSSKKPTPRFIQYLGKVLPGAVFSMLVIYCLKDVDFLSAGGYHGLPEMLGILVTVGLHLWKKNMMISIAGGTVFYMVLVQLL